MKNNVIFITNLDTLENYGGFVPVRYKVEDMDSNFRGVKFYLNGINVYTSNKKTDIVNLTITQKYNKLSGYSFNKIGIELPDTKFEKIFTSVVEPIVSNLKISTHIKHSLPDFIQDEYPKFVDFIEEYYKFLESSNNPNIIHYNLENYRDIDTVPLHILDFFKKELIPGFSLNLSKDRQTGSEINERNLLKNIKQFYSSKGTENSIKFLFRILFDKEAEIFYPRDSLLRPSDGVWIVDKTIIIFVDSVKNASNLLGAKIYQKNINDEIESHGIVKNIEIYSIFDSIRCKMYIHEVSGTFSNTTKVYENRIINGVETETEINIIKQNNKILFESPGRFHKTGGLLSDTKRVIPDNLYWQEHSYDVKGDANSTTSYNIIKKLAHPTGFRIFTSYTPLSESKISYSVLNNESNTSGQLLVGNLLPYRPDTVQDLNYISSESTDGPSTFRMFPSGILFGEDGYTVTENVKQYVATILDTAKLITSTMVQAEITQEIEFHPRAGQFFAPIYDSNLTIKERKGSNIANFGQLHPDDIDQPYWGVSIHPRDIILNSTNSLSGTDQPYNENTPFSQILVGDLININITSIITK